MNYYPLKFKTIYKDKIWGGQKIKTVLGKDFAPLPNCGETWELSGVKGNISVISNGMYSGQKLTDLIEEDPAGILGHKIHRQFRNEFPLLVKFIDANDDLSVQVHPDDIMAQKKHQSYGKTEMWYIMQSDPGATLISGFNRPMDRKTYQQYFESGQLMEILNREKAVPGDVFFLPAGRVHTIGKGLLLAEIQQTSDVTYRIYDFDRTDDTGHRRELHLEDALDAMDYQFYDSYRTKYQMISDTRIPIVKCPYFTTNKWSLTKSISLSEWTEECFRIYICLGGQAVFTSDSFSEPVGLGDVVLLPAEVRDFTIETTQGVELLESYIE